MRLLPDPAPRKLVQYRDSDEREVFADLESLDESLTTRTFSIIGFAVVVVASLGAAATSGHVPSWLFVVSVMLLALALCAAAASLIRGRTATRWEADCAAKVFAEREAGRLRERVVATQLALVLLAAATLATAASALFALHFNDTGVPVTCQVTVPTATAPSAGAGASTTTRTVTTTSTPTTATKAASQTGLVACTAG